MGVHSAACGAYSSDTRLEGRALSPLFVPACRATLPDMPDAHDLNMLEANQGATSPSDPSLCQDRHPSLAAERGLYANQPSEA